MLSKTIINPSLKFLNCAYIPINKPKNICIFRLQRGIKLDVEFTLTQAGVKFGQFPIGFSRFLEPFASGIVTIVIGRANLRRRNFIHADYEYIAKVEFGVEREHSTIDGRILSTSKVDHLDSDKLKSIIRTSFDGTIYQECVPTYRGMKSSSIRDSLYNSIVLEHEQELKVPQKYPKVHSDKESHCHIELIEYEEPFATFKINCTGSFNTRRFVSDLSEKLNIKASLVELTRLKEGPFDKDDLRVVQLHDASVDFYLSKLPLFADIYRYYLTKLDDKFGPFTYRKFP